MLSLVLALAVSQVELPPEARVPPPTPQVKGPSVEVRSFLSTAGGTIAGGAGLGVALLLTQLKTDATFATAALGSLLITGVAFSIHEALGGRGEIILAFLGAGLLMAGAAGIAVAIDGGLLMNPVLTAAIGSLPAAGAAVLALELTTPAARPGKPRVALHFAPTGVYGTF